MLPRRRGLFLLGLLMAAAGAAHAQTEGAGPGIYTCVDDKGRRLTADRPLQECLHKEQRILNRDGSLRAVQPPAMTADERAVVEAQERAAVQARVTAADAARRDRNLLSRYANEEQHHRARVVALDPVRAAIKTSERRVSDLAEQRKPLQAEVEFYKGKPIPNKLKSQLAAIDVASEAQRAAALNQEAELARITLVYDTELARLKRLWAGATPGSMGPMADAPAPGKSASSPKSAPASSPPGR